MEGVSLLLKNLCGQIAVIGLLYLAGVFKNNHRRLCDLWNTSGTGMEVFLAIMIQRQFEFLIPCQRIIKEIVSTG